MKAKKRFLSILLGLVMVLGLLPGMSLTAYAASEVTGANVKCMQYSYFEAYQAGLPEITNITLAEAQAFGVAISCPTTYWMVVYAKDGNNLKWTSNSYRTGEQTSTSWENFIHGDAYICPDPMADVTIYFSKGLTTISVTGVTLNKESTTLTVGGTETLTATVAPDDATDKTVTWSSSNTNVATVSDAGLVTAVAAGTATITVTATNGTADGTSDDKTATCAVTVNAAVTEYPLWVGGVQVTSTNSSGTGWSYDVGSNTIALSNYSYTGVGHKENNYPDSPFSAIYYTGTEPLTIQLSGANSITRSGNSSASSVCGIKTTNCADLTITGSSTDSLNVTCEGGGSSAIYLIGSRPCFKNCRVLHHFNKMAIAPM